MDGVDDPPSSVLDDIAYLSRSEDRIEVLETLTSKPYPARELRERTGTTKSTLNRILNEFQERSWTRRTRDGNYEATAQAEHVARELRPFVGALETIRRLGEDVAILPMDELTIGSDVDLTVGLHHFSDATVERQRPQAHGVGRDRMVEAARTTSTLSVLADMSPPRVLGTVLQERAENGELSGTQVFTAELAAYLREHPEEPPRWSDVIEAGIRLYRYDERIPATLFVADGVTLIWGAAGEMRRRVVVSENETVRTWALDVIDRYRERSEAINPTALA